MSEEHINSGGAKQELPHSTQTTQSARPGHDPSGESFLKEGEQLIVIPFRRPLPGTHPSAEADATETRSNPGRAEGDGV